MLDGVADSEDEEEQVKPAAKPGQKQQYVADTCNVNPLGTLANMSLHFRKKNKIQTPSNGEDLVEDMDLADFENSDDEEMAGDE